jgi:hypothetical protein
VPETTTATVWFVHKYEEQQAYGGPEEGGWWYDLRTPIENWAPIACNSEEAAFELCRLFNSQEYQRRDRECRYGYTSVLSHHETFYWFMESDSPIPTQPTRPHYE